MRASGGVAIASCLCTLPDTLDLWLGSRPIYRGPVLGFLPHADQPSLASSRASSSCANWRSEKSQ
jgi:hypothetical protein